MSLKSSNPAYAVPVYDPQVWLLPHVLTLPVRTEWAVVIITFVNDQPLKVAVPCSVMLGCTVHV